MSKCGFCGGGCKVRSPELRQMLFTYPLPIGEIRIEWLSPLPLSEMDIIRDWFDLIVKKALRRENRETLDRQAQ